MSVQFLSHPKFQAFDANGDPLNGGLVYTYEVGTTSNKATYPTISDAKAATNANANPVVLDSRGEADIVLAGATKIVLKDSNGTTIWTLDNINGEPDVIDSNGNELTNYVTTSSAVNHIQITNAATGNGPTIEAIGDDTNVDLNINAKGSGSVVITNLSIATPFTVQASNSSASEIRLPEDTDNGSNYMAIKSPASITTTTTLTLPDGDAGTADSALVSDTAGTLSWKYVADAATQAEQETATSTTDFVSPGRQQYHPSAAKAWASVSYSGGTPTILASYNVSSLTDLGAGITQVNFTNSFSSANYVVMLSKTSVGNYRGDLLAFSKAAGYVEVRQYDSSGTLSDSTFDIVCFGDQ